MNKYKKRREKEKRKQTIPSIMSDPFDLSQLQQPLNLPFPAVTRQAAGMIKDVQTDVLCVEFSDKILITISQKGRLAHWVRIFYNHFLVIR